MKLVIECSTPLLYIGLYDKGFNLIKKLTMLNLKNHGSFLINKIKLLLEDDIKNLDVIYCGIGPGSYTGSRVAVVCASMIAAELEISLYSLSSLLLLASSFYGKKLETTNVIIDAKNNNVFYTQIEFLKTIIEKKTSDQHGIYSDLVDIKYPVLDVSELNTGIEIPLLLIKKNAVLIKNYALQPNYIRPPKALVDLENNLLHQRLNKHKVHLLTTRLVQEVFDLDQEVFKGQYTFCIEDLKSSLDKRSNLQIFVITSRNDGFIGYIAYRQLQDNAYEIINFAIKESSRKKGLGNKLYKESVIMLKKQHTHALTISLECSKNNLQAIQLYEKNGFSVNKERENYYGNGSPALFYLKEEN